MQNALISVVIPIYNVEQYLTQCINSVLSQTYRNLEIILVDDGSTDRCPILCDKYSQLDSRVKVIHKENGGLSDARNAGLDIATGSYVSFIDSDDFVEQDYIEALYNLILKYEVSVSACSYIHFSDENILSEPKKLMTQKCTKEQAVKYILIEKNLSTTAWGKLYDIHLFKNIRFPKGKIYEDLFTIWKIIDQVDFLVYTTFPKYHYRLNPQSIMTSKFSDKSLDFIEAHQSIMEYVLQKYPKLYKYACWRFTRYNISYLYRALKANYKNENALLLMQKNINQNIFSYLFSCYRFGSKAFGLITFLPINILKIVVK